MQKTTQRKKDYCWRKCYIDDFEQNIQLGTVYWHETKSQLLYNRPDNCHVKDAKILNSFGGIIIIITIIIIFIISLDFVIV